MHLLLRRHCEGAVLERAPVRRAVAVEGRQCRGHASRAVLQVPLADGTRVSDADVSRRRVDLGVAIRITFAVATVTSAAATALATCLGR